MMMKAVFLAVVLAALGLTEAVIHWLRYLGDRRDDELRRRLHAIGEPDAGIQLLRRRRLSNTAGLDALFSGSALPLRIERLLEQTDLEWTVASFAAYTIGAFLVAAPLSFFLLRNLPIGLLIGSI